MYIYVYMFICIYIYIYISDSRRRRGLRLQAAIVQPRLLGGRLVVGVVVDRGEGLVGLRTSGVHTTGAAAKVMNFDRLGKKVRPGTFGKIKVG